MRHAGLTVTLLLAAFAPVAAPRAAGQDAGRALAIARDLERVVAERPLWPDFEPLSVPLAVYTGGRTYLFRHPSPPEEFTPLAGVQPEALVFEGRHPSVVANTTAEIGGVTTATLLLDGPGEPTDPRELAALALHEAFHAFQRARHRNWAGNEAHMLTYPVDDVGLLALRRREAAALRRALAAADDASAACWTRLALDARRERFAAMDSVFPTYERRTELNEGLAVYIELVAAGRTVDIPESEYPPAAVRQRVYTIGPALAFLLDRFRPGWQAALEEDDTQYLDGLLRAALDARPGDAAHCGFGADEAAEIELRAREDVAGSLARRTERRRAFDDHPGWRVVIEAASGQPLWPRGFDPINLERVDDGLLHARFLRLGNDAGELSMVDDADADLEALTEAAGEHPLFNGVARVTIAGFAEQPEVGDDGGRTVLRAPGFTASFQDAAVEVRGRVVVVRLR